MCWINTKTFHNFYKRVEWRQKNYRHSASVKAIVNFVSIKQERSDSPAIEPDLNIVKCEVTEPTPQAIDLFINKEEHSDYDDDYSYNQSKLFVQDLCRRGSQLRNLIPFR